MTPIIALENVSKAFGSTLVIERVSLPLYAGQVHALMGENGAGKSTMVKMLSGVHKPDDGQILFNGKAVVFDNTADAKTAGVAVIYQEPTLFPELSIAENIFMGRQPLNRYGMIDYVAMNSQVREVLKELGVPLEPTQKVLGLSIAEQQIVEIAKALTVGAKVLIMDEPTAALSSKEVERLFCVTNQLRETGVAILFISHRLEEVFTISQRVTIMRDGLVVDSGELKQFTTDDIIKKMVGRSLDALYPKVDVTPGETILKVNHLQSQGVFDDIDFEVKAGEIVALAGLVGAGRSEVALAIFGIDSFDHGNIQINGQTYNHMNPVKAMAAGIGLVPEDRRAQGLIMPLSVIRNTTLTIVQKLQKSGLVRQRDEYSVAEKWTTKMQLRGHLEEPVGILSGGNQQKVVLAKWLATNPKCLIVDEPTRGVDVGAKAEVHRTLSELAAQGMAILMISSELPEVLGMADRILVMHEGRITAEFSRAQATEEKIMYAATGQEQRVSA